RAVGVGGHYDRRERNRPRNGQIERAGGHDGALSQAENCKKTAESKKRDKIIAEFEIAAVEQGGDAEHHNQNGEGRAYETQGMRVPGQPSCWMPVHSDARAELLDSRSRTARYCDA